MLGIGRRDPHLHQALLDWSRKTRRLYLYDTIAGGSVPDPQAHRENLADHYQRTRVAITNYAKWDVPEVVGEEREIPGRLWEGLASGAQMIGKPPDEELQTRVLGHPVVAPIPDDPSAAVDAINEAVVTDQTEATSGSGSSSPCGATTGPTAGRRSSSSRDSRPPPASPPASSGWGPWPTHSIS